MSQWTIESESKYESSAPHHVVSFASLELTNPDKSHSSGQKVPPTETASGLKIKIQSSESVKNTSKSKSPPLVREAEAINTVSSETEKKCASLSARQNT